MSRYSGIDKYFWGTKIRDKTVLSIHLYFSSVILTYSIYSCFPSRLFGQFFWIAPPPPPIPTPPSSSRFLRVGGGRGSSRHLWHDAWSTVRRLGQDWLPSKWQTVGCKLQVLVYDIIPSTTAVFSYAVGPRKLSANEQFFCWCWNSSKFVTNNSNYIRHLFYNWPWCLRQLKSNHTRLNRDGTLFFYPGWMRLMLTCVLGR